MEFTWMGTPFDRRPHTAIETAWAETVRKIIARDAKKVVDKRAPNAYYTYMRNEANGEANGKAIEIRCDACSGMGVQWDETCVTCGGVGVVCACGGWFDGGECFTCGRERE